MFFFDTFLSVPKKQSEHITNKMFCSKIKTMMDDVVAQEWAKVKDFPSLFRHYGSQSEYQRWRTRFITAGLLQKSTRTFIKKRKNSLQHRRALLRTYARNWREKHPAQTKQIMYDHWKRKLLADFAKCVRLNPDEKQM